MPTTYLKPEAGIHYTEPAVLPTTINPETVVSGVIAVGIGKTLVKEVVEKDGKPVGTLSSEISNK